jgi:hypothetical protein
MDKSMPFSKKLLFFIRILLIVFIGQGSASGALVEDEDFGVWSQYDIEKKVDENLKLRLGEDARFRETSGLFYFDTHAGLSYRFWGPFIFGAEYLQVRSKSRIRGKERFLWEYRPRNFLTAQTKLKGYLLENRNMLEYRFKESQPNSTRYRNLTGVTAPYKWTRWEFQPYASEEIFIETGRNGVVENRIIGGLKLRVYKNLYGSVYYMRQSQKNNAGAWRDANVLGTGLKLSL